MMIKNLFIIMLLFVSLFSIYINIDNAVSANYRSVVISDLRESSIKSKKILKKYIFYKNKKDFINDINSIGVTFFEKKGADGENHIVLELSYVVVFKNNHVVDVLDPNDKDDYIILNDKYGL